MIYSDKALSQKLERTEARSNADFVETRSRLEPESDAGWIEVAGAYAMFDGPGSPLTQTFGLGLFQEAQNADLAKMEEFFRRRGAPVFHEVSPLAEPSTISLLNDRGYRPVELSSVMYRTIQADGRQLEPGSAEITTRVAGPDEAELWAGVSANGWATEDEGLAEFMLNFGRIAAQCNGSFPFLAEIDGVPVASGSLFVYDDVCLLAGASTIAEARGRGAQSALLRSRLRFAAENGCTLAVMVASPGSQSQKNAQKNGFRIAYTRIKWQLMDRSASHDNEAMPEM